MKIMETNNQNYEDNLNHQESSGLMQIESEEQTFYCLSIIGQIEGHYALDTAQKSTKYDHIIPLLVALEESPKVDGIIVVTTPQDLVGLIVSKALNMAEMMNIPVVGLVENMSYFMCPDCGKMIPLFGDGKALEAAAAEMGLPVLAKLPMDPAVAGFCDKGCVELADPGDLRAAAEKIAETFA